MGSLGQRNSLASEKPLSQMRMRGQDVPPKTQLRAYLPHLSQSLVRGLKMTL